MEKDELTPEAENNESSKDLEISKTKKKRKKPRGFVVFLIILSVLLALAITLTSVGIVYVKKNFNYRYNDITSKPEDLGFQEVKDDEIVNIALFGIDTTTPGSFKGRSDSIMILSINKTDNKIKLISVLRDSYVPMESDTDIIYAKINNAYASGGPERAIKTLNNVFALDISEYATVNFYGMADIIDAMGGVEITVTSAEINQINSNMYQPCKKRGLNFADYKITESGTQLLNGMQAVGYARIRYVANAEGTTNDYGRTDRQRLVLGKLFEKVKSLEKSKYVNLIKTVSPYCETSLSYTEILGLALDVLMDSPSFEESRVPSTEYTMKAPKTSSGSIAYYDLNFAANLIHAFIYEDVKPEDFIKENGVEKTDWYKVGYQKPIIITHEERQKKKAEAVTSTAESQNNSAVTEQ